MPCCSNMGRQTSDIWDEFYCEIGENNKRVKATCKHCGKTQAPNATRCTNHIKGCMKCPAVVRALYSNKSPGVPLSVIVEEDVDSPSTSGEASTAHTTPAAKRPGAALETTPSTSTKEKGQGDGPPTAKRQILSFVDKISKEEKDKIDQALAAAIYANGLPLSTFENVHFQRALSLLRPSYGKPPSRFKLGGTLLDREFALAEAKVKSAIQESDCVALMADGCATVNREHVINFIVTTPQPMLYTYKVMGTERETSELIATEFITVLNEIGPNRCYLLVTDNASVMTVAMGIVTLEFPHITAVGCASHCWNLLFKDLMELNTLHKLFMIAKSIVKSIRNVYVNHATFKLKQKEKYGDGCVTLKLPAATRWGGAVITFNSLIKNKAAIQETVVNEDLKFSDSVRTWSLDNVRFWDRVKIAIDMLKPLHGCITLIESNKALLSDVFFLQKKYTQALLDNLTKLPFKTREKNLVKSYLEEREVFTIRTIHKACFLLDPRYRDKHDLLEPADIVSIIEFIGTMCKHIGLDEGAVIASLAAFRTRTGFFAHEGVWRAADTCVPNVWWAGVCATEPIAPLARRILSLPPSVAECERNWKLRKFIHSKTRNRLLNERVRKLVATKAALKEPSSKPATVTPFFTVADIDAYFENYLPARAAGAPEEGPEDDEHTDDGDVNFEEEDSEDDDYNDRDYENISDWSDGDDDDSGARLKHFINYDQAKHKGCKSKTVLVTNVSSANNDVKAALCNNFKLKMTSAHSSSQRFNPCLSRFGTNVEEERLLQL
ncbi:uncharacterized protein LOC113206468 [Frankliniella occidentalis]|uniref:Uncharacterized protein LOC113206468 n=1 Tax=Frankliniella occidentalis TaxID=133901 RepID=A0A6J1SGB9_FRAOC|nr:uncharacterized protein LOC113206468 [Frankliniella occidentalis]